MTTCFKPRPVSLCNGSRVPCFLDISPGNALGAAQQLQRARVPRFPLPSGLLPPLLLCPCQSPQVSSTHLRMRRSTGCEGHVRRRWRQRSIASSRETEATLAGDTALFLLRDLWCGPPMQINETSALPEKKPAAQARQCHLSGNGAAHHLQFACMRRRAQQHD